MKPLDSAEGQQAVATLMRGQPLLAFDFDGTLAPIVPHPDDARIAPDIARHLAALAERLPVAVITGRSVADVTPRLQFTPRYIIGNHGAEDPDLQDADGDAALGGLRELLGEAAPELTGAGVSIEDKAHSIALHYRRAPDEAAARAAIESLLGTLDPRLRRFGGKCVENVVSARAPDKGQAVATLMQRSGADTALFAGDDVNDEAVFLRAPPHWLTVRVGRDATSAARYYLDGTPDMALLLGKLRTLM